MTSPVSPSETIAKAMEGVTPGRWLSEHGSAYGPVMAYNVSADTGKALSPVICHVVDHPEARANAAYIAACSPDRMREVLDELSGLRKATLKLEAMEREMENLREALQNLMGCYDTPLSRRRFPPDDFMSEALSIARTLIQGEKK